MKYTPLATIAIACLLSVSAMAAEDKVAFSDKDHPAEREAVVRVMGKEFQKAAKMNGRPVEMAIGLADVNGDGKPDIVAHFNHSYYCGSLGCSGIILLATSKGYAAKPVLLPNFQGDVFVLATSHKGMKDVRFDNARKIFHWDGRYYR